MPETMSKGLYERNNTEKLKSDPIYDNKSLLSKSQNTCIHNYKGFPGCEHSTKQSKMYNVT